MQRFLGAERPCRLMVTSGLGIGVIRQKFRVIWAGLVQWREFCRLLEGYRQPLARPLPASKAAPSSVFCFSTPGRWQQVAQWHCHPWCLSYLSSVETPSGSRKDQNVMTADDITRRCWGPPQPRNAWWPQVVSLVQTPVPEKNLRGGRAFRDKTSKIATPHLCPEVIGK